MIHASDMKNWFSHLHRPRFTHGHLSLHWPYFFARRGFWLILAAMALVVLFLMMIVFSPQGDLRHGGIYYYPGMLF